MDQDKPKFRIEDNILIGEEIHNEPWNLGEAVLEKLKSRPKFMAQIESTTGKYNTFEEILEKSVKCAIWLRKQGIEPGDVLGICVHNCLEVCVPIFATLYLAAVISSWDHDLSTRSARYYLELISPKLVFVTAEAAARMREAAREENKDLKIVTVQGEVDGFESLESILASVDDSEVSKFKCYPVKNPEETAAICCSSGTTGLPKGTELSYLSLYHACTPSEGINMIGEVGIWLATIRWQLGLSLIIESVLSEARVILIDDNADHLRIFEAIDKFEVTYFVSEPSGPLRWVKLRYQDQYTLRSLRKLVITGCAFDARKQQIVAQAYPHMQVLQCHGMTDCGGLTLCQTKNCKPGSCGFVCKGQRIKIVDTKTGLALGPNQKGEMYIKSPYLMKRYHKNPEVTKKALTNDGWLRTNDLAYYDEDGEVFLTERISEFINYMSINLSPAEIESVLESHPWVMRAAVVPVPHEIDEEHPMAFIVTVPGKEVTVDELTKLVKDNLPWYCELRAGIHFVEEMPLTVTGKLARKELREMAKRVSATPTESA